MCVQGCVGCLQLCYPEFRVSGAQSFLTCYNFEVPVVAPENPTPVNQP